MSRKYIEWASNDVAKLKNIFEQIQNLTGPEQDALIRGDFYRTAHDIKGQGATFDYPLMSDLGAHLCTLIKTTDTFDETHLAVMAQDIEDMALVLAKKVQGEGGQIGERISNRLKNG
ncbi:MAG: peptide ABC transporter substrate-binding protein [Alphaproteobacteria bacterium]|nr:peptide ABC transporter substrate-binding protein [Alphaproteobacteria bacterium]